MGKLIDLTGQRFGRWVVLGEATDKIDHRETWLCSCDCGTVRNVLAKSLKSGRSKSCGCIAKEKATHRMTQKHLSKLSGISTSMISAIELGERHPTVPVLDALARALQVKVTDLYSRKF